MPRERRTRKATADQAVDSDPTHGQGRTSRGWDLSYGIDVFAFPIQQSLISLGADRWPPIGSLAVSMAVALPVAALSWRWVELPMLRRKRLG